MLCESRQFQEIEHQRLKNLGSKEKFYFDESASFFEQISSMKVGLISRSSSLQYFVPTTIFTSIHFGAISKSFSIIWPARFVLIFFYFNIYFYLKFKFTWLVFSSFSEASYKLCRKENKIFSPK